MHRLRRILALALLALWLPATLHCDLEAAGLEIVFVCHDHETHPASDAHRHDDACHALESASFKPATDTAVLSPPTLCACLHCFVAPFPAIILTPPPSGISDRIAAPPEVARTWHFLARAAPPARAPSAPV